MPWGVLAQLGAYLGAHYQHRPPTVTPNSGPNSRRGTVPWYLWWAHGSTFVLSDHRELEAQQTFQNLQMDLRQYEGMNAPSVHVQHGMRR